MIRLSKRDPWFSPAFAVVVAISHPESHEWSAMFSHDWSLLCAMQAPKLPNHEPTFWEPDPSMMVPEVRV